MKTLLVVNSSGRVTRSITRHLSQRFTTTWRSRYPNGRIVTRDLLLTPPPFVNERWIAAAFTAPEKRTAEHSSALEHSEVLLQEIEASDEIVIATPMYNFGMPAALKAYVDQIVRVGRTFDFLPGSETPYRPLLESRPVTVLLSVSDGSLLPGRPLAHLNHLEPHLATILEFIGLRDINFVRVGDEEFGGEALRASIARAEAQIDQIFAQRCAERQAA
jgi:FMN-dependent NADH-azoreductase